MQYKFLVDGEWKHDEHQPCSTTDYGVVNTVLLPGEANYNPIVGPEMALGSGMELDNETFRRVVRYTLSLSLHDRQKLLCVYCCSFNS